MDPALILATARGYAGVRFKHQGRSRAHGVDCLGLLFAVAREAGVRLQDTPPEAHDRRDYGHRPDTHFLQAKLEQLLVRVADDRLQPADIVLLRIEGRPQHLAMVTDYPAPNALGIIHAYAPARKVVEHRLDAAWMTQIAAVYRLPDLERK